MNVSIARYILGVASLSVVVGSFAISAVILRRRFLPDLAGALAVLAQCVIGLGLLIAVLELLGTVGLFRLAAILGASVLVGAGVWWTFARPERRRIRSAPARAGVRVARGLPGIVGLLAISAVVAEWANPTIQAYDVGVHVVDSVWYHLPWAASFAQTGHITPLRFTDVEFLTAFYPANAELLHALGIVLLGRDTLSPALNLIWLGLAFLAGYCIGAGRGRGILTLLAVALAMATPMIDFSQPGGADNDILGVFFFLAAVALVLAADERREVYVLAALAAGFAAGVKLTFLFPVAALSIGIVAIAPRRGRLRAAAWWGIPALLAGGFWYVRNLIAVGNPLPWTSLGVLPTPAAPLQADKTFSITHYASDPTILRRFLEPALSGGLGRWWIVIIAAAILGPLACLLPGSTRAVRMLALVALGSIVAYLFTPNSAMGPPGDPVGMTYNVRYVIPALTLSLALIPLAPALSTPRRQLVLLAGLAAVFVATVALGSLWPDRHLAGALSIGAIVAIVGAAAIAAPVRRALLHSRFAIAVALVIGAVLAGAAGGYAWQRHYLRARYAYKPGVSYLAPVWAFFRAVHNARVGLAGTYGGYFAYPLFGVDDSNRVQYVARRGPHGSFTPITSCREWRSAVNAGHFRYLVTTPTREFWRPHQLFPSPEDAWTKSDPGARRLLTRRAFGQAISVYELRARLDPGSCPRSVAG